MQPGVKLRVLSASVREWCRSHLLRSSLSEESDGREGGRGRRDGSGADAIRAVAKQPFGKGADPGRVMETRHQCRPTTWCQPRCPATTPGRWQTEAAARRSRATDFEDTAPAEIRGTDRTG